MKTELIVKLGQVVQSKAGRDKGRKFVVVGIQNEDYILLADGDLRKVDKPKRKKMKHIKLSKEILAHLQKKMYNNVGILNSEIQKSLKKLES